VIGINAAINANGQGLGFAIPVNQAKKLIPDLKKYGRVLRGWLGALVVTTPNGIYIDGVVIRSGAHRAGLQSADRISEINGSKIEERSDIDRALEDKKPGDRITIIVERAGRMVKKVQTYDVKLGEEPEGEIPAGLL
jgi:serine protease Do